MIPTILKRRWVKVVALVLVVLAGAYVWLFLSGVDCESCSVSPEIGAARKLARSHGGSLPTEIRVEQVAAFRYPAAVTMAGAEWKMIDMVVCSYQIVYPDRTVIVDTAMDADTGTKMRASSHDATAFARMNTALEKASTIVVTHEHADHIGGLVVHPNLKRLMTTAILNREQVEHAEKTKPLTWPAGALDGYKPLVFEDRLHAVAPGVVLIRTPGHTPGSQMVFVSLADGEQFLFLGDVAWQMHNVEQVSQRPRIVTILIGEDREQVYSQLAGLHAEALPEPRLHLVPGHDAGVIESLTRRKLMTRGFQ